MRGETRTDSTAIIRVVGALPTCPGEGMQRAPANRSVAATTVRLRTATGLREDIASLKRSGYDWDEADALTMESGRAARISGAGTNPAREIVNSLHPVRFALHEKRSKIRRRRRKSEDHPVAGSHVRGLRPRSLRPAATPVRHTPSKSRLTSAPWEQFQPNALEFLSFSR
ncbi:Holliday junction ATP-dependent DNA helicase RuvA [Methylorubrum populi]|uniref:Holliday junction ATP-dependent DNA helicase RuvA n=1 Tax=Methylorubrum populi TaxID=223967 RepID=A0A160PGC4_9HYPH|nr:Holliday junction ATP-dependent DNA helicase RuvA [Methylorubrum populi]